MSLQESKIMLLTRSVSTFYKIYLCSNNVSLILPEKLKLYREKT